MFFVVLPEARQGRSARHRPTGSGLRLLAVLALVSVTAACGGISLEDDQQIRSEDDQQSTGGGSSTDTSTGNDTSDSQDPGDPTAFRLGRAGWENACTVLGVDEVSAASGYEALESREGNGCTWVIEGVDTNIIGESLIGWQPMIARQVDIQQGSATTVGGGIVVEPIDGLGTKAFWQGNEVNALGEVWVQTDQIGFRITNQFASGGYEGDTRSPMESLAAAIVEALAGLDVIAASGESGATLIPPDRIDIPEGIPIEDSLIDELSAVPLPDGAVVSLGGVYDRASQDVFLDLSVGDAARFFLEALPAAGFEITSGGTIETEDDILEFAAQSISFIDPDGNRGDIGIREGAFSPSQLNIQIFLP